ncbi:MAG: HDOD domain-containing protein [Azonexaceae bacterium]|nr:HDOD domain-containing protein [Azonexaceae bacterium]
MTDASPSNDNDKTGDALSEQRFSMLSDIARELSSDIVFPTYFDAILRLRQALENPDLSLTDIGKIIALDPLISAKLLHMANSAAFNSAGRPVVELKTAVAMLGLTTVRSTAMAIAMRQLMRAKSLAQFASTMQLLWEHTIRCSAAARVLAEKLTRVNPDEAMLAGLIHDLGAFYMLYRATQYEELRNRPDSLRHLILHWHESIGISLLTALGLPDEIVNATAEHDRPRLLPSPPSSLHDIIYIANLLAGSQREWLQEMDDATLKLQQEAQTRFQEFLPDIEAITDELQRTLKGD